MDNLDKYISVSSNNILPAKGRLLLSEPLMGDFYFGRAVILLAEHDDEGTFGVVLNKPILQHKFNEVVADFPDFDGSLFVGGPVEPNNLFFIHTVGDIIEGAIEIGAGIYWGGDIDIVKDMINYGSITPNDIRFSVGYSGWSPKQLQSELKKNSWVVSPYLDKKLLKMNSEKMWGDLITLLGDEYKYWSNFPSNPGLN